MTPVNKFRLNVIAGITATVAFFMAILLVLSGWVMNIFALANATEITGLVIARCIGILVFPVGALLGWFA